MDEYLMRLQKRMKPNYYQSFPLSYQGSYQKGAPGLYSENSWVLGYQINTKYGTPPIYAATRLTLSPRSAFVDSPCSNENFYRSLNKPQTYTYLLTSQNSACTCTGGKTLQGGSVSMPACVLSMQTAILQGNLPSVPLGTGQYLWEYGTGKFATGPPVILVL